MQTLPVKEKKQSKLSGLLYMSSCPTKMSDFWFSISRLRSGLYVMDLHPSCIRQRSNMQRLCRAAQTTMQRDNLRRAFPEATPALVFACTWIKRTDCARYQRCTGWIMQLYAVVCTSLCWHSGLRSDWMLSWDDGQNGKIHHCWQGEPKYLPGVTSLSKINECFWWSGIDWPLICSR